MNFDIIDIRTTNLIKSYLTAEDAWADWATFDDPDFVVFEVLPTGRRRRAPMHLGVLMDALVQSIEQARRAKDANSAYQSWTVSRSKTGELALTNSAA